MTATAKSTSPIGACSKVGRLLKLDGRTKGARRLREIEFDLTEHVGGPERVSTAQRYLIQRTAIDILRLELLDAEMTGGVISDHTGKVAHALRNSVRLSLREIGMAPAATRPPSPAEALARLHARTGEAA